MDRRSFLHLGGAAAAAAVIVRRADAQAQAPRARVPAPGGQPAVITPNGWTLPLRIVDGVKVGHLVAESVDHEFAPGLRAQCWGYNGGTPGPTIEAVEGDRLRLYVTNRLPEATTVHWHGIVVPNGMDGVAGLTQPAIEPGETFAYEFTLPRAGTFMYHPHFDEMTQIALGMHGMFVVHPRRPRGPRVDRDFALMTHEWRIDVGARRPHPSEMSDFNVLTFNSKAFPSTEPLLVGRGERVRIRLGNLSPMDHHPIHIHGVSFRVTGTDGGEVPASAQLPETTVLVPVGATRDIELVPDEPGDWPMHCHMTHHIMTQMGHGLPNLIGADLRAIDPRLRKLVPGYMTMGTRGMGRMGEMNMPVPDNSAPMRGGAGPFGYIDMGGMFTVLKVREDPKAADAAGWYAHPAGSVSSKVDDARMQKDGVDPDAAPRRG
jgi:FtsP/CotA-like multicopper oxidase with cupredoxin domain